MFESVDLCDGSRCNYVEEIFLRDTGSGEGFGELNKQLGCKRINVIRGSIRESIVKVRVGYTMGGICHDRSNEDGRGIEGWAKSHKRVGSHLPYDRQMKALEIFK